MRFVWILLALLLALPACRRFTKAGADREVYGLLGNRRALVPEVRGTLDVEAKEKLAAAIRARTAFELTLRDALELATVASREYQTQRENVFLTTLTLTRQLNEFRPLWDSDGSINYDFDQDNSSLSANMNTILSRAFERGGGLVIGLANSFLTDITGNPLRVAQSILSADITLPLLRGAGELVAKEQLRQAERDVLYALRDYARFQQEFTVTVATSFYRALQDRDRWRNAESRYESLTVLVDEQREKASAGRLPKLEVDQIQQDLLQSDDARQRNRNRFDAAVDRFKLQLGIPVGVAVTLEDGDLKALRAKGPQGEPFDREEALTFAQKQRLDLLTVREEEEDAKRHVLVARDALRAGLDVRLGGDVTTPRDRPFDLAGAEAAGTLGIDYDLPLERTAERNAYRRAMIAAARARRNREAAEDTVVFEVRDAYRTLAEAARSYEIQRESARLADRRVESTQLLLELGRALTRDRLDAETARLVARNAVTAALVDHALSRLALERDVGTLAVDAKGLWDPQPPASRSQPGPAPTEAGQAAPVPGAASAARAPASQPAPAIRPGRKRPTLRAAPLPAAAGGFPPAVRAPAVRAPATAPAPTPRRKEPAPPAKRPSSGAAKAPTAHGGLPPPKVRPRRARTVDAPTGTR